MNRKHTERWAARGLTHGERRVSVPEPFTGRRRFGFVTSRIPRDAFTLIELLVVIAIIGLLISLMTPSLRGARQQALKMACMGNLRQIGMAALLYSDDNKGSGLPVIREDYPTAGGDALLWGLPRMWPNVVKPYLGATGAKNEHDWKEISALACPASKTEGLDIYWKKKSYAMHWLVDTPHPGWRNYRLSQVINPSEKFFILDGVENRTSWGLAFHHYMATDQHTPEPVYGYWFAASTRHGGQVNVLRLDGRVSAVEGSFFLENRLDHDFWNYFR